MHPMIAATILVVDDNVFVLNTISAGLKRAGFDVLTARSADEALQAGVRHQGPIHLILLDVILPGMDGMKLASEFARLHPESRSLFMTGLPDTPEVAEQIVRHLRCVRKPGHE